MNQPVRPSQEEAPVGSGDEILGVEDEDGEDEAVIAAAYDDEGNEDDDTKKEVPPPISEEVRMPKALRRPNEPSKRERD